MSCVASSVPISLHRREAALHQRPQQHRAGQRRTTRISIQFFSRNATASTAADALGCKGKMIAQRATTDRAVTPPRSATSSSMSTDSPAAAAARRPPHSSRRPSGRAADPRRLRLPRRRARQRDHARAHAELERACSRRARTRRSTPPSCASGCPTGQMGNSEVGHLNIGAGRVVYQDFTRIDDAIATGEFARNPRAARRRRRPRAPAVARCTCSGLLSPGGVHSHERQIAAMVELAARARRAARPRARVPRRPRHAAAQRRGVARRSWTACARSIRGARIASICGRYYAMDRDQRWERVAAARTTLLVDGDAPYHAPTPRRRRSTPPTRAARPTSSCKPTAIVDAGRPAPRRWTTATSSCS